MSRIVWAAPDFGGFQLLEAPVVMVRSSLFDQLSAEYPEVSGPAVAQAVDRAAAAAAALGGGAAATSASTALLARDRLDALRERAVTAVRRAGMQPARTEVGSVAPKGDVEGPHVPCTYCRAPIPAGEFGYWSSARRLLSAPCPACRRPVTVRASTWRRLGGGGATFAGNCSSTRWTVE